MIRLLVACLSGAAMLAALATLLMASQSQPQIAANRTDRNAERQEIRATPLLERPNRPGHFYGNTVRRLNALRSDLPISN